MRVPYEWLQELVAIEDPPEQVAERLSLCALEVEEIERPLDGVTVAHLTDVKKHPNADRLSLCTVELADGSSKPIVCGASNMKAGDRVALALPGTELPGGLVIKKSKIRGETSEGMLCSAQELELGEDHDGILILDESAQLGAPAAGVLGLGSAVLEVDILPDRGDCASILGIAREVAALYDKQVREPDAKLEEGSETIGDAVAVDVQDAEGCPRYLARLVRGVSVGPSPEWLARRLLSIGQRPINNVVDVTNLVLHELGQPLHAFDAAKIPQGKIVVRRAQKGEALELLDESQVELDAEDLVIADAKRPIALAGVMGGASSAVSESTRDVILECARFEPRGIRRSARRHGQRTESSYRFERGVDPEGLERAVDRAAKLLAQVSGGSVARGMVDVAAEAAAAAPVELRLARVPAFLGIDPPTSEIEARLSRLGVQVEADNGVLRCQPPSWRHDLRGEADLLEEIVRLGGYEAVPATLPEGSATPTANPARAQLNQARSLLRDLGYSEAVNLAFLAQADLDRLRLGEDERARRAIPLQNPLGEELALLRTSLLPALLRGAAHNLRRGVSPILHFEVGRIFLARPDETLPEERRMLAAVAVPSSDPGYWSGDAEQFFFAAKHAAQAVCQALRRPASLVPDSGAPHLHPGSGGKLEASGEAVGSLGRLHPEVATAWELPAETVIFELDLDALEAVAGEPRRYAEPPRFPAVNRDLALLVDKAVSAAQIEAEIRRAAGNKLEAVTLFDNYAGKGIPKEKKSLAFRLTLRSAERTLKDQEIGRVIDKVVAALGRSLGAEQR